MSDHYYPAHASLCPGGLPDCWDCAPESFEPAEVDRRRPTSPSEKAPDACCPEAIRNAALEEAAELAEKEMAASKRNLPERTTAYRLSLAIRALKSDSLPSMPASKSVLP